MSQQEPQGDLASLVAAASVGNEDAWTAITDRFTNLLWSVARSFRLNHDDAADVVQNTWLRLLENLTKIEKPEALPGWLTTTARREALGVIRRRRRTILTRDDDIGENIVDTQALALDAALLDDERDAQLWAGFGQLSASCQQLLRVLMATDRPAYADVSEALGMPVGSIGPTRMRCLARLRAIIAESGYYIDGPKEVRKP